MNQTHTDQGAITSPPCPRCGKPMTDRDMGEADEYQCKPCRFALAPLSHMRVENKGKLLFSMTEPDYEMEALVHLEELIQWLTQHEGLDQSNS